MATKKFTDAQLETALRKHCGIKAQAAKALRVDRASVQERVEKSPRLQQVIREIEEAVGDMCEGNILRALKAKDKQTSRWYAERKLKRRGYAPKLESETKLADGDLAAIVAAFGGDVEKLRAARAAFDPTNPAAPGES